MNTLIAVIVCTALVFVYMNTRVSLALWRSTACKSTKAYCFLLIWLVPFLGVLLIPKKILPKLHKSTLGSGVITGGDCGDGGG